VSMDFWEAHYLTANKRKIKDFPKLTSATSFIRKTLYVIYREGESMIIIRKYYSNSVNTKWTRMDRHPFEFEITIIAYARTSQIPKTVG